MAAETTTHICTETVGGVEVVMGEIVQGEGRELGLGAFLVLGV